jgi:hypothetical protein
MMLQSSKGAMLPFSSPLIFIMFVVNYKAIHGLGKRRGGARAKGGWLGGVSLHWSLQCSLCYKLARVGASVSLCWYFSCSSYLFLPCCNMGWCFFSLVLLCSSCCTRRGGHKYGLGGVHPLYIYSFKD